VFFWGRFFTTNLVLTQKQVSSTAYGWVAAEKIRIESCKLFARALL